MHITQTTSTNKNTSGLPKAGIQNACEQLKNDIARMLNETESLNDRDGRERFKKLHRLNELKQILSTIEDIDHSVDQLLKKQVQK